VGVRERRGRVLLLALFGPRLHERLQKLRLDNKQSRARLKDVKADRTPGTYANRILRFLEVYAKHCCADGLRFFGFSLEKEVTATLVGSTAIAAIGLVGFMARGLFKPPSPPRYQARINPHLALR